MQIPLANAPSRHPPPLCLHRREACQIDFLGFKNGSRRSAHSAGPPGIVSHRPPKFGLGPPFRLSWPILALSFPILVPCWLILAQSWAILAPSWPILAPSWCHLGATLAHLGPILAHLRRILAHLGAILAQLRPKARIWKRKSFPRPRLFIVFLLVFPFFGLFKFM